MLREGRVRVLRERLSETLCRSAAGMLGECGGILLLALVMAWLDGMMPSPWGISEGNHGPWRHYHPLREMVSGAELLPVFSTASAWLSVLLNPCRRTKRMLGFSVLVSLVVIQQVHWLVD
ncbi:MAG: hypothetical protein WB626_02900 [Bacteroidota bacterium]